MHQKVSIQRRIKNAIKYYVSESTYNFAGEVKIYLYEHLILPLFCFGFKNKCLLCGKRSRKFLPVGLDLTVLRELHVIGGEIIPEARCPRCRCNARERLLYLFLQQRTAIFRETLTMLHIAPERMLRKRLKKNERLVYVCADLKRKNVDLQMDIADVPFKDKTFDVIICNHVLEHVPDDRKAMSEFSRVLKPGGWAILQVPVSTVLDSTIEDPSICVVKERERRFGQGDHVRIYGQDYVLRLRQAGFTVTLYNCLQEFGKEAVVMHKLDPEEGVFFCSVLPGF